MSNSCNFQIRFIVSKMISVSKYFNYYHHSLVVKSIKPVSICSAIFMCKLAGVCLSLSFMLNMILKKMML